MLFRSLRVEKSTKKRTSNGAIVWECKCDCGNVKCVSTGDLKSGYTRSCGCLNTEDGKKKYKSNDIVNVGRYRQTKIPQLKQKTSSRNTSGYKGVSWRRDIEKWNSYINLQGKHYSLGVYESLGDAIKARKQAEEELFHPIIEEYEGLSKE